MKVSKYIITFIINPISGIGRQKKVEKKIANYLDVNKFTPIIRYTEYAGHAKKITEEAIKNKVDVVVAVGGDGTVNEVGTTLIDKSPLFAIIPTGSGNGLARHMKIPMQIKKAILLINKTSIKKIDTVKINQHFFLGTAGIGFDAHISELFVQKRRRGFFTYIQLILKHWFFYTEQDYKLILRNKEIKERGMAMTFASASQYGNNLVISPNSIIDDGLLNIIFIYKIPLLYMPVFLLKVAFKQIKTNPYIKEILTDEVTIKNEETVLHIDGEPIKIIGDLHLKVLPKSLKIICK